MATTAKLIVVLKADDTIVSEVEDPILWQRVLAAIQGGNSEVKNGQQGTDTKEPNIEKPETKTPNNTALGRFQKQIGVSEEEIRGALDPILEPPYLQLDRHCWEAMKKYTPQRGKGALSATAVAGTLLALWLKEAGLGTPTQSQASEVLQSIGVIDKNPSRGIKGSPWLQGRKGGAIVINPAQISKAAHIAKCFCTKTWTSKDDNE